MKKVLTELELNKTIKGRVGTYMNNVINWLLDGENPEVKYRTMTELLDMTKENPVVKTAQDDLLKSEVVGLIMDRFKLNNKWEDVTAMLALAEFGLTRSDVPIDDYMERTIKNLNLSMKCAKVLLLRNLVSLGYYNFLVA